MRYDDAPIGSRWWGWGHHWEVVAHITHDGEPAVRTVCCDGGRRKRGGTAWAVTLRTLERSAIRMDDEGERAA